VTGKSGEETEEEEETQWDDQGKVVGSRPENPIDSIFGKLKTTGLDDNDDDDSTATAGSNDESSDDDDNRGGYSARWKPSELLMQTAFDIYTKVLSMSPRVAQLV
jgi:hypothetical protein